MQAWDKGLNAINSMEFAKILGILVDHALRIMNVQGDMLVNPFARRIQKGKNLESLGDIAHLG